MAQWKDAAIEDTVYFWFAANDTGGSGGDGATPLSSVRLAGAAGGAAAVLKPTPTLLSHADFPDGCHEIAVAATDGNGFAADNEYAVFCTLLVDSQNPAGLVGSFFLTAVGETLHTNYYQAKVEFVNDEGNATDRYTVTWFKNGEPITSGTSLETIQVIKSSDGSDLVASTGLTEVASLGIFKHAETTNRQASGATYRAKMQATIDGATRTWYEPVGRDST